MEHPLSPARIAPERPWRQRRRLKEQLIRSAAVNEFCKRGYAGTSLQDIADVLRMNKATLCHYIESKEFLLAGILNFAHDQLAEMMSEVSSVQALPAARLQLFLGKVLYWYLNNLQLAKVAYHEWTNLTGVLLHSQRDRRREFDEYVRELIRLAQIEGTVRPDLDVALATNFIIGAINAVPAWYQERGSMSAADLSKVFADMAMALVASPIKS